MNKDNNYTNYKKIYVTQINDTCKKLGIYFKYNDDTPTSDLGTDLERYEKVYNELKKTNQLDENNIKKQATLEAFDNMFAEKNVFYEFKEGSYYDKQYENILNIAKDNGVLEELQEKLEKDREFKPYGSDSKPIEYKYIKSDILNKLNNNITEELKKTDTPNIIKLNNSKRIKLSSIDKTRLSKFGQEIVNNNSFFKKKNTGLSI